MVLGEFGLEIARHRPGVYGCLALIGEIVDSAPLSIPVDEM